MISWKQGFLTQSRWAKWWKKKLCHTKEIRDRHQLCQSKNKHRERNNPCDLLWNMGGGEQGGARMRPEWAWVGRVMNEASRNSSDAVCIDLNSSLTKSLKTINIKVIVDGSYSNSFPQLKKHKTLMCCLSPGRWQSGTKQQDVLSSTWLAVTLGDSRPPPSLEASKSQRPCGFPGTKPEGMAFLWSLTERGEWGAWQRGRCRNGGLSAETPRPFREACHPDVSL